MTMLQTGSKVIVIKNRKKIQEASIFTFFTTAAEHFYISKVAKNRWQRQELK